MIIECKEFKQKRVAEKAGAGILDPFTARKDSPSATDNPYLPFNMTTAYLVNIKASFVTLLNSLQIKIQSTKRILPR